MIVALLLTLPFVPLWCVGWACGLISKVFCDGFNRAYLG